MSLGQVAQAIMEPLMNSDAWYGVFFALALRKEMTKTLKLGAERVQEQVKGDDEGDTDGN